MAVMAKNKTAGDSRRVGAVKSRSQIKNPITGTWTKRDNKSGKFMDVKADRKPFKGARKARRKPSPSSSEVIRQSVERHSDLMERLAKPAGRAAAAKEREYRVGCNVVLRGATMFVKATSPERALQKVRAEEWDDIEYAHAEVSDWNIIGDPIENS
jgi:hypothetical protein